VATATFRLARSGKAFGRTGTAGADAGFSHKATGTDELFYVLGSTTGATHAFFVTLKDQFFKIFATGFAIVFIDRH
jgi:hypothetical protein